MLVDTYRIATPIMKLLLWNLDSCIDKQIPPFSDSVGRHSTGLDRNLLQQESRNFESLKSEFARIVWIIFDPFVSQI
jgi:hypothetical protein